MRTALAALAAAFALAPVLAHAQTTDTEVALGPEPKVLHGSIMRPAGAIRPVAVLMIAGSGPTDRNSNSTLGLHPDSFRLIADALAKDGVTSLRFDKRGIAASTAAGPSEADLRFGTYVDDAVAWAERLRQEPGVRCVVILGHSEGALIAAMAASRTPVCGLISVSGAGRPADQDIMEQLAAAGLPPATLDQVRGVFARLKAGQTVPDAPLPALFRPSVQPYLISWVSIDPAAEIARVKAPTLILQGDTDLQIKVTDARRLAAAKPDARLVILPGVNHVLKTAPLDRAQNLATYADPTLPLAPGVAENIIGFVNAAGARH